MTSVERSQGWTSWSVPRRLVLVDLLALAVALGWFAFNVTLPDAFAGRLCCDSVDYMGHARRPLPLIFSDCAHHPLGYPLFLRAHLAIHGALGLPASPDWISLSLGSAFVLFVVSVYALYHALWYRNVRVPRVALWLLLLHPGLVSHAASPITDSLTLSLLMLLFACTLRFEWDLRPRNLALAVAIGFLPAAIVLTRTTHYVAALVFLGGFVLATAVTAVRRRSAVLLLFPLLVLLCFERATAPRRLACLQHTGVYRFLDAREAEKNLRAGIQAGWIGARSYGLLLYDLQGRFKATTITVPDPFMKAHFDCLPMRGPLLSGVATCFLDRAQFLPGYFGKKLIALFDISHLNPHAASITTPPVRWWNRSFSMLAFAGFACLVALTTWAATERRLSVQVILPLVYLSVYVAGSLIPHIEARYGLPLVPPSIVALVLVVREARNPGRTRWAIVALLVSACAVFLAQTVAWDRVDPGKVSTAARLAATPRPL